MSSAGSFQHKVQNELNSRFVRKRVSIPVFYQEGVLMGYPCTCEDQKATCFGVLVFVQASVGCNLPALCMLREQGKLCRKLILGFSYSTEKESRHKWKPLSLLRGG